MNTLIMNQSVVDMCASFLTLLTAVAEMDGTHMSRDSISDRFLCHVWITRLPLWDLLYTSTYGILLTALDRYVAIYYPIWYKTNVSNKDLILEPTSLSLVLFCLVYILANKRTYVYPSHIWRRSGGQDVA